MKTKSKHAIKFAVGSPQAASAIWQVKSTKRQSDVYVIHQSFGPDLKVSLHAAQSGNPAEYRFAWTKEATGRNRDLQHLPGQHGRVIDKWSPAPVSDSGLSGIFSIVIPHSDLRSIDNRYSARDLKDVVFIDPPPGDGDATEVVVVVGVPGRYGPGCETWPGKDLRTNPTSFIGRYDRADGCSVWAVAVNVSIHPDKWAIGNQYRSSLLDNGFNVQRLPEPRGFSHVVDPDGYRYIYDYALD